VEEEYVNVRGFLGHLIGRTIVDVTQHDREEYEQTGEAYIMLMFNDGNYLKVYIGDEGFDYSDGSDDDSDCE
jgi:hypothetical protein